MKTLVALLLVGCSGPAFTDDALFGHYATGGGGAGNIATGGIGVAGTPTGGSSGSTASGGVSTGGSLPVGGSAGVPSGGSAGSTGGAAGSAGGTVATGGSAGVETGGTGSGTGGTAGALSCPGTPSGWMGCLGCGVCVKFLETFHHYLTNHPTCAPVEVCTGATNNCTELCPYPTTADE